MNDAYMRKLARIQQGFAEAVPYNRALGLQVVEFGKGKLTMRLPYDERFVGNPTTGVIHGGVITATMDATCGGAVFLGLREQRQIATLDLRIDYLRPATPGEDVICEGDCYRITRQIAFTRGVAHQGDADDPIASSSATFIIIHNRESELAKRMRE